MALKARLASLEGVPEALHGFYKSEGEGKPFVLDVEPDGTFRLEDVGALVRTKDVLRGEKVKLEEKLALYDGLDPIKARDAQTKVAEMANWTPEEKLRERIEALKGELGTKHSAELKKLQDQLAALDRENEDLLVDRDLHSVLAPLAHNGDPSGLMPHAKAMVFRERDPKTGKNAVRVRGPDGHARTTMKPGSDAYMGLDEVAGLLSANPALAPLFKSTVAAGGGAGGSPAGGGHGGGKTVSRGDLTAGAVNPDDILDGKVTVRG